MKSSQLPSSVVLLCLIILLFANVFTVKCDPDTTIYDYNYSNDTYPQGGGYEQEVEYGFEELTYGTCNQPNYQYTVTGTYVRGFAYCQLHLSTNDCVLCLEAASDFLQEDCAMAVWAYVVMTDCYMRYGPTDQ